MRGCIDCKHNPANRPISEVAKLRNTPCHGCWFTPVKKNFEAKNAK